MQPGLKAKGRGLQAFVRGKSDGNAHYNASAEKPSQPELEKRSATPNANEYIPSRQELAEFARLPLPGAFRKSSPQPSGQLGNGQNAPSPVRRGFGSPARPPVSRVQSTHAQHDIFNGSQLGENFMNSGLSTPVNESEDLIIRPTHGIKAEEPRADGNQIQSLPPRHSQPTAGRNDEFSVARDGRLSVVPGVPRYHPSEMKDGFQNNNAQQLKPFRSQNAPYTFPAQSLHGPAKLPMRGVRINRALPPATNALTIEQDEVKSRFIERGAGNWEERIVEEKINESILVNDSDDDFEAHGPYGGMKVASKVKLQNGFHPRVTREDRLSTKPSRNIPAKEKKRRRPSLDYDDKILSSMTYQDLQEEPFDVVPQALGMNGGHDASASKLTTRLEQFQQQGEREQHQFFSNMSIDDWENSGDWFADQFSGIMNRLRNARREKRQMIREFETEASHREEAIRVRTDTIDRKLTRMKHDGQRVVGDKDF
ncbi:extracellular mutant protein 11 domain-containing protein [Pochonia chlamydosporia 170]|uniref:Extracellular mutant protein 11 domain-containing protein n=1 Tax=Pochonia chlamydosporia 170 TaxID=1380566 RepID=A0A179FDE4_METCM|nr:extracellular mutant protein 11 domain-containing protein [Pochonia chlamydosporia 170]OAQ63083.1 extracellular mutant protein 11 domain-containing protein [Pochonia chlamydosporia 170]